MILYTQGALPDDRNSPTQVPEPLYVMSISGDILLKLGAPKCDVRRRGCAPPAPLVPVPETTVDHDDGLIL